MDEDIPGDDPLDKERIEGINPSTGVVEKIRTDDPQYYSADGFKTRRYKGSSKPMDIPSFVWQSMSVKARREAAREEQMKLPRSGAERRRLPELRKNLRDSRRARKALPVS